MYKLCQRSTSQKVKFNNCDRLVIAIAKNRKKNWSGKTKKTGESQQKLADLHRAFLCGMVVLRVCNLVSSSLRLFTSYWSWHNYAFLTSESSNIVDSGLSRMEVPDNPHLLDVLLCCQCSVLVTLSQPHLESHNRLELSDDLNVSSHHGESSNISSSVQCRCWHPDVWQAQTSPRAPCQFYMLAF